MKISTVALWGSQVPPYHSRCVAVATRRYSRCRAFGRSLYLYIGAAGIVNLSRRVTRHKDFGRLQANNRRWSHRWIYALRLVFSREPRNSGGECALWRRGSLWYRTLGGGTWLAGGVVNGTIGTPWEDLTGTAIERCAPAPAFGRIK